MGACSPQVVRGSDGPSRAVDDEQLSELRSGRPPGATQDPRPRATRAELAALDGQPTETARRGSDAEAADASSPTGSPGRLAVRHRRAARRAGRRPEPDEPGRRRSAPPPGSPPTCATHGPGTAARRRSATTPATSPTSSPATPRPCSPAPGCARRAAPAAADAGAGLRRPPPRRRRRRHGHRQPQPAAGQRLQGLPRRRRHGSQIVPPADAEIAAADRRGRAALLPTSRAPTAGARSTTSVVDAYLDAAAARRSPGGAARPARRLHAAARRRRATSSPPRSPRAGFAAPYVVAAAGRARPGLPDRRVPQPGGAGRDGPRVRRRAASATPTW